MKHIKLILILGSVLFTFPLFSSFAQDVATNSNLNSRKPAQAEEAKSFFDLFNNEGNKTTETSPTGNTATQPFEDDSNQQARSPVGAKTTDQETPVSLTNEQRELMRVQYYLNSLSTIVSDFTQIAPDGAMTMGKFYLKRPGKIRWEYSPPTPILIIANGKSLVYYDKELEQVSHLPIDSTLAGFLAREKIDLNDPDLKVDSLTTAPGVLRITLSQRKKPEEGSLLLEFADQPLQIRNMVITDAQKQVTTVSLSKARFGVPLDNYLFIWQDPRKRK